MCFCIFYLGANHTCSVADILEFASCCFLHPWGSSTSDSKLINATNSFLLLCKGHQTFRLRKISHSRGSGTIVSVTSKRTCEGEHFVYIRGTMSTKPGVVRLVRIFALFEWIPGTYVTVSYRNFGAKQHVAVRCCAHPQYTLPCDQSSIVCEIKLFWWLSVLFLPPSPTVTCALYDTR